MATEPKDPMQPAADALEQALRRACFLPTAPAEKTESTSSAPTTPVLENASTPPTGEQDEDPHLSTTPSEQDAWDEAAARQTPEEFSAMIKATGDLVRSKLMNADGSLKPATSDLQRNVPAPQLKVVK